MAACLPAAARRFFDGGPEASQIASVRSPDPADAASVPSLMHAATFAGDYGREREQFELAGSISLPHRP